MKFFLLFLGVFIGLSSVAQIEEITIYGRDKTDDAIISSFYHERNFGEMDYHNLYSWTLGGAKTVNRLLLKFDLNGVPKNAEIVEANLLLYYHPTLLYGKNEGFNSDIDLYPILSDWEENSVTWSNQPEVGTAVIGSHSRCNPTQENDSVNILNYCTMVQRKAIPNFGIQLQYANEDPYKKTLFCSSENKFRHTHPRVVIRFKRNNVLN